MRDPRSLWSPLPESGHQGTHVKTQFIVHSTGDTASAEAIFRYFSRPEVVVESTFIVGLTPEDPTRQILDSTEYADANLNANGPAISVEVVGSSADDYTDWQKLEIIRLGKWAKANHPIEARVCPSPTASGFGWHVMWGAPGPWTPVAKVCPGALRIKRLQDFIFPAIFAGTAPTPLTEDPPMFLIRNTKGSVALLADTWGLSVPGGADPTYKSLQKGLPEFPVSDTFFDRVIQVASSTGAQPNWDTLVAKLVAALPPVDVPKLAATIAADIKAPPVKAAAARKG